MTAITTALGRIREYSPLARMVRRKAAAVKIPLGAIVVENASGYATNGTLATGLVTLGICAEDVDNSGGAAGDKDVKIFSGLFWVPNSGTNPVTQAHVERSCYVEDNNLVGSLSTGMSVAGVVKAIDATKGVLVQFGLSSNV